MGSWNGTCGVTQLPIFYGNKIRAFVLSYQITELSPIEGGGTCYSNDIWKPLVSSVQGTYNDYGNIENIVSNVGSDLLQKKLRSILLPFEEEYEEVTPIESMPLQEMLYWIERNKANYKNYSGEKAPLGVMLVLEDIYQAMISFYGSQIGVYRNPVKYSEYEYMPIRTIYEKLVEEAYLDLLAIAKLTDNNESVLRAFQHSQNFWGTGYLCHESYFNYLSDLAQQNVAYEDDRIQQIKNIIVNDMLFSSALSDARKMWMPQCGQGSQNAELLIYKAIAKATNNVIKKRERQDRKEGIDFPDENGYYPYMLEHNAKLRSADGDQKIFSEKT
jgi:hypothetical protein